MQFSLCLRGLMSFRNFLLAIDYVGNTLLGGSPGETISARAWRNRNKSRFWGLARKGIDRLFFFDGNHCEESFQSILDRKHLPAEYQTK